jgi:hypothetical protein
MPGQHSALRRGNTLRVGVTRWGAVLVAATALLLMDGGGGAFGDQTGMGPGAAGDHPEVTAQQTSTVAGLSPGSGRQALSGDFSNESPGPVYVTAVAAAIVEVNDAEGDPITGCTAADFLVAGTGAVGALVPAGDAVGSWGNLTIEFNNTTANQDACKGARLVIRYTTR